MTTWESKAGGRGSAATESPGRPLHPSVQALPPAPLGRSLRSESGVAHPPEESHLPTQEGVLRAQRWGRARPVGPPGPGAGSSPGHAASLAS